MERTKDDILRCCFTSYLWVTLKRARNEYIKKEIRMSERESLIEDLSLDMELEIADDRPKLWEDAERIPLTPEAVRLYLDNQVSDGLKAALDTLTEQEILVVYMKVIKEMTHAEIGSVLGTDWVKAGSTFAYAKKKMIKGRKTNK